MPARHFCFCLLTLIAAACQAAAQDRPLPPPRAFAPGVETTIPIEIAPEDTFSVHDVIELRSNPQLQWRPELLSESSTLYSRATGTRFQRDVWQFEFTFKPLRMMWVEVPLPTGEPRRELVWYMVYRVTNRGEAKAASPDDPGVFSAQPKPSGPVRFLPQFVLEGHDRNAAGEKLYRAYLDRLVPAALESIRQREVPGRRLKDSVSIAREPIPVSTDEQEKSVWGVATWVGVDPETDFFSVYVRGLTNAYKWEDPAGAYPPGAPPATGREFVRKTLQLNFWRPGDQFLPHESEVRFGVAPGKSALYGVPEGVAYRWVYR